MNKLASLIVIGTATAVGAGIVWLSRQPDNVPDDTERNRREMGWATRR